METMIKKVERALTDRTRSPEKIYENEKGIVLPAVLWWMGVPLGLLLLLWLIGVF